MRTLETEFTFAGHYLRQIWRQEDVAVFARSLSPEKEPHELELVIIKVQAQGTTPSGSIVPEHEAYPGGSRWGTLGWSFPIRYREWVLALAEKLSGISKGRPAFVRQATHELWLAEKTGKQPPDLSQRSAEGLVDTTRPDKTPCSKSLQ